VTLEEMIHFLAEPSLPMMLLLCPDVSDSIFHARYPDAESAEPFLPCELACPEFRKCFPQPFRRVPLDELHGFGHGQVGGRLNTVEFQMDLQFGAQFGEFPDSFEKGGGIPMKILRIAYPAMNGWAIVVERRRSNRR
jgi:hypothetical protein